MKREKLYATGDHSKVEPAWKVLLTLFFAGVFAFPLMLLLYDTSSFGEGHVATWLGVNNDWLGTLVFWIFISFQFLLHRVFEIVNYYHCSKLEPVRDLYESKLLRLTYVLLSLEEQEKIIEPVYSDWIDEREVASDSGKFDLFKVDIYYYLWFTWRLWRESGVWRSYKMRSVRNPQYFKGAD